MLHPVLWIYSLVVVLGTSNLGLLLLFNNQTLLSLTGRPPQAMLASLTPLFGVLIVLGVIGFVFATFGDAALIHLINQLEIRKHVTACMGLDGADKIFQLLVVRVLLILPNVLVIALALAVMWGQLSRVNLLSRANPLSGLFGSFCGFLHWPAAVGINVSHRVAVGFDARQPVGQPDYVVDNRRWLNRQPAGNDPGHQCVDLSLSAVASRSAACTPAR
jgi:hypothetical protein